MKLEDLEKFSIGELTELLQKQYALIDYIRKLIKKKMDAKG